MVSHWYYMSVGGQPNGPVSIRKLRQLASAGQLRPNDRLRMDGNPKSVRAGGIVGLFPTSSRDPAGMDSK